MKTKSGPFSAWLKTLPLALSIPAVVWILVWGTSQWSGENQLNSYNVIVLGMTILVHFLAYVVTGLPIFLIRYKRTNSPVWLPQVGISFGALLGALAVALLFGFQFNVCLMGVGYGTATALAALLHRPTYE